MYSQKTCNMRNSREKKKTHTQNHLSRFRFPIRLRFCCFVFFPFFRFLNKIFKKKKIFFFAAVTTAPVTHSSSQYMLKSNLSLLLLLLLLWFVFLYWEFPCIDPIFNAFYHQYFTSLVRSFFFFIVVLIVWDFNDHWLLTLLFFDSTGKQPATRVVFEILFFLCIKP